MRVILADDHTLFRAGIKSILERVGGVEVVAESGDGRDALAMVEKHRPDVALLDITMPGLNGLEVAARVAGVSPKTRVVILSMHANEGYVAQALRAGVAGYLLKDAAARDLESALKTVLRGDTYLSPSISKQVVEMFLRSDEPAADPLGGLTARQREILQLIAEGRSTKEIAADLGVSVKTVETHRAQLMERLDIHDIPGLVRFAIRAGLVSSDA
jgi:DNA-binding NarL/FixJ family response regulator